jgi:hypothetical protein
VPRFILTHKPTIHHSCFVHPSAVVAGFVTLGESVSIWPNAVLRGDSEHIKLYDRSRVLSLFPEVLDRTYKMVQLFMLAGRLEMQQPKKEFRRLLGKMFPLGIRRWFTVVLSRTVA